MGCVLCNMAHAQKNAREHPEDPEWDFDLDNRDIREEIAADIVEYHPKIAGYVLKYILLSKIPRFVHDRIPESWYQKFHEVWK